MMSSSSPQLFRVDLLEYGGENGDEFSLQINYLYNAFEENCFLIMTIAFCENDEDRSPLYLILYS